MTQRNRDYVNTRWHMKSKKDVENEWKEAMDALWKVIQVVLTLYTVFYFLALLVKYVF